MNNMNTSGTVLIVTNKTDITADLVVLEFQRRGTKYARFNTEEFPQKVELAWELSQHGLSGYVRLPNIELALQDVKSVWYRRPSSPHIADSVRAPSLRDFAYRESQEALAGLWRTLTCFWMSSPDAINSASYKPRQLQIAHALGFNVPRTLISNSPEAVKQFELVSKQIIAKPLFSGTLESAGESRVVFTTLLTTSDLIARETIRLAPSIFQEYIHKDIELRVTVVGSRVFAASINSQEINDATYDWRRASPGSLCFQTYKLPTTVSDKCERLVAKLGLAFATIDMVKTPAGDYVFLELNPNGQWGWLENPTGDPYTSTIANLLENSGIPS